MLVWCWQIGPRGRPTIGEILNILISNCAEIQRMEESFKRKYAERHRWKYEFENVSL